MTKKETPLRVQLEYVAGRSEAVVLWREGVTSKELGEISKSTIFK